MKQTRKKKIRQVAAKAELSTYQLSHPSLVYRFPERTHERELTSFPRIRLEEAGYATEDYEQTILDREETTSTVLELGVAIPHGTTSCVCHPAIAAAILWRNRWTGAGKGDGPDISSAIESGRTV